MNQQPICAALLSVDAPPSPAPDLVRLNSLLRWACRVAAEQLRSESASRVTSEQREKGLSDQPDSV